jgi:hypothetical protein
MNRDLPYERGASYRITFTACDACMQAHTGCTQYTIHRIPKAVDDAVRERARLTGKSLKGFVAVKVAVDTNRYVDLCKGVSSASEGRRYQRMTCG